MNDFLLTQLLKRSEKNPSFILPSFLDKAGEITHSLTLEQWLKKAQNFGQALSDLGVKKGERVILSLPTSEEFLVAFLGLWWIGAVPVPFPEPSPKAKRDDFGQRLIHVIQDCEPAAILIPDESRKLLLENEALPETIKDVLSKIQILEWSEILSRPSAQEPLLKPLPSKGEDFWNDPDAIAFIQYTSGSTGSPKGVVVTQKALYSNCLAMAEVLKYGKQFDQGLKGLAIHPPCLNWMPLYHDMAIVGGVILPSYFEVPFFLLPTSYFIANPKIWLEIISRHKISAAGSPNFIYNFCAKQIKPEEIPGLDLSGWRIAFNGAEPIDPETLLLFEKKFRPYGFSETTLYPVYGMAEATVAISFPPAGTPIQIDRVQRKELLGNTPGRATPSDSQVADGDTVSLVSVGRCLPDHQLTIRDPAPGTPLSERQVGQICFSGPSVCPGYYRDQNWLKNPVKELQTGDLGYIAEGNLYIVDRLKDVILIGGTNYYPSDIENEVTKIEGIQPSRAVAFGVFENKIGTSVLVVVAEINRKKDTDSEKERIKKEIRTRLFATHGIAPREIVLSKHRIIPLTTSGKIMRRRCQELYMTGTLLQDSKSATL
jgi:fatty-acyl-CoA synthase